MKVAKADMKRVLDALQQLNDVRLDRIRELIRQRNDFQQETITLKLELAKVQENRDDRLERWRSRWISLRDENKRLQDNLGELNAMLARKEEELKEANRLVQYQQYAAMVTRPASGMCDARMTDDDSGEHDPHWCDKTPNHGDIDGPSPHRCGDCKQEWVVD